MFIYYNTFFLQEYIKLFNFLLFSILLSSFLLFLSVRLTVANYDPEKLTPYECGFEPYEDARNVFDVRFYLIAILFLIFDLETLYFFPWVTSLNLLNENGFWYMIEFTFELLVGYVYALQVGSLNWN